ncbi:hypothetical protein CR513_32534, partial [Mucuna pruriens]
MQTAYIIENKLKYQVRNSEFPENPPSTTIALEGRRWCTIDGQTLRFPSTRVRRVVVDVGLGRLVRLGPLLLSRDTLGFQAFKTMRGLLALPTIVHPRQYRLQWLSEKGELLVDRKVKVMFTLRRYEDRVVCDVVPMEATHLLLRRPWQFDKKVIHDGVTNDFTFIHMGQRVVLKPLSSSEVQEDQKKINVKRESERKTESKIRKKSKSDVEKRKVRGKEKWERKA